MLDCDTAAVGTSSWELAAAPNCAGGPRRSVPAHASTALIRFLIGLSMHGTVPCYTHGVKHNALTSLHASPRHESKALIHRLVCIHITRLCSFVYVCMYVYIYIYMCLSIFVRVCVCMHACTHTSMDPWIHVSMYACRQTNRQTVRIHVFLYIVV